MSAVKESIGFGVQVFINDGASNAYVLIDNLVSVTPPAAKLGTVDSKRVDLPSGVIIKVPTIFDGGEVSMKIQFGNVGFARFETLRKAKTNCNFKFIIPDDMSGTTVIAPGYVVQNKTDAVESEKITEFDCSFVINGPCS